MKYNRKKIACATTVPQSLGFFRDVMLKMMEGGYEITAISSPGEKMQRFQNSTPDIKCVEVPMKRQIALGSDVKSLWKMMSVLRKERPIMIHSMTPKAGMISMVAGWLTGVPVRVHTFTGLVWPTSMGWKRKVLMMTDRLTCACATHVIPEGQGVMNDLKNGHITNKPLKVLGYGNVKGIDLDVFNPLRFDAQKTNKFTFLFVGRIVGDKGINELVEAFIRIQEEYPNTQLQLVGNYNTGTDPVSPQTYQRMMSHEAIHTVGPKFGDDLLKEYAQADCFVMPSYREGFPNTVIEAGAMGLPCVVTDINGSREIIDSGKNGLIVPSKDVDSLYKAMRTMLCDDAARMRMASNARPMIACRFDKKFVQACLISYYEDILN